MLTDGNVRAEELFVPAVVFVGEFSEMTSRLKVTRARMRVESYVGLLVISILFRIAF